MPDLRDLQLRHDRSRLVVRRFALALASAVVFLNTSSATAQTRAPIRVVEDQSSTQSTQRLPLRRTDEEASKSDDAKSKSGFRALTTITSSLVIVLGAFFLLVWAMRRANPKATTNLPTEVLEPLGRSAIAGRVSLQLIRLGGKLLLVAVTPDGAETLAEVTDGEEVERLTAACRQNQPDSISHTFREVLHQLGSESRSRGRRRKNSRSTAAS